MPHLPPLHPHPPNTRSHTASRFTRNLSFNSGIIKTTDGGVHWERKSKGMWDTRVNGVWVHPDDKTGNHVFAGTHSGVYESTDGAENWELAVETAGWGTVMSFLPGMIGGKPYIIANNQNGILTKPSEGGKWQKIIAPGGIAGNAHISLVLNQEKTETEVLTCIGGWGGGQLYYAHLDSPTNATWDGPLVLPNVTYTTWADFPGTSAIWGKCKIPTCPSDSTVHDLGVFDDLKSCQTAVNATAKKGTPVVATWTYQSKDPSLGDYAGHCYVLSGE